MLAGECGIRPATLFDTEGYRSRIAAEVPIRAHRRRRSRRSSAAACRAAIALACTPPPRRSHDAGLLDSALDRSRVGVFLGAGTADLLRNEQFYRTWITAGARARAAVGRRGIIFSARRSTSIAERFGFEGPRACVVAACSSSTIAIGRAADAIRRAAPTPCSPAAPTRSPRLTFSGFNQLRLMDPAPCRPFDRSRAGMNIGEGAGILVLEDLDRARRRGARIYAELAGYALGVRGVSSDGARARRPAGRGGRSPPRCGRAASIADEVDHINAHGTATPQNDAAEARGFRRVFGDARRDVCR